MFNSILETIRLGGYIMYPLFALAIIATVLICDKILLRKRLAILPKTLSALIENYQFKWQELEQELQKLDANNYYRRFLEVILKNRRHILWWLESRAADEARLIEKEINSGLWILETIITAAPLLGLLGTITGMMDAFKLIGAEGLVNPTGITAGVAQALIATAFGLLIAILALFAFNYFSNIQNQIIEDLERLGSKTIDHIRLDNKENQ
jgi:biopolymer transport protein ExbB